MQLPRPTRAIVIVLDSVGIGELPDAHLYADEGSDTVGNIARAIPLRLPTMRSLGFDRLAALGDVLPQRPARGAFGRMAEVSAGKDSVTGHWELMGIQLEAAFPTYPHGFPADIMQAFEARIGRGTLGNVVASGTAIIDQLGDEHVRTGKPIVYTSADSVFQIAAHEDVVPVPELYRMCEAACDLLSGRARASVASSPAPSSAQRRTTPARPTATTTRTRRRRPAALDRLTDAGHPVV